MTRGLKLNNPMNIKVSNSHWQGEIRPTADPIGVLCQFDTVLNGIRAGAKNLANQQILHGLNTWTSIITKYAPAFENNTQAYINAMVKGTGCAANTPLDLTNSDLLETSCRCVILHEQGSCPFTDDEIAQAVSEALN